MDGDRPQHGRDEPAHLILGLLQEQEGLAFGTAPVVMANEAHDGMRRCVRTRRVGVRLVRARMPSASATWRWKP